MFTHGGYPNFLSAQAQYRRFKCLAPQNRYSALKGEVYLTLILSFSSIWGSISALFPLLLKHFPHGSLVYRCLMDTRSSNPFLLGME
jgi:hypothetical protein